MPRSSWTGAIDLGGFPIHVSAYALTKSKAAQSFKSLCPCHHEPIVQHKVCATTGEKIAMEDLGKGVELTRGTITVLPPEAVEQIKSSERSDVLAIQRLSPVESVPLHLATGHYRIVANEKVPGSAGPVGILYNGLRVNGLALVTEWIPRAGSRNQLVVLHADAYGINANTLPYATDLQAVPEGKYDHDEKAAAMFTAFADQQGIDRLDFTHTAFEDAYSARRADVIEKALAGETIQVSAPASTAPAVPDLLAAMEASLAAVKAPKAPAKKPAARKKAAPKAKA